MPLYEYQCEACAHRFERIQKFSDLPVETCPACGGKVRKLLSSPAIQFKGSGWYITDYARQGRQETTGGDGDKPASSDQSDKSAKKTDSASTSNASSSSAEKPASTPAPAQTTKSE
jgi:putative FmdB family regulatory protein